MDKRTLRNKKSKTRNAKPYDRPNQSILGRVASKFKGILNPSWIFNVSQWMGTPEEESGDPQDEESGEEDEEPQPVAHGSKRPRLGDQPPPSILSEGTQTWLDTPSSSLFSPTSRLTSTVTQNSLIENKADQVIINGDDHSENSEGSASTSGCSSLVSSHKERSNCLPVPNRRLVQSPFQNLRNELSRRDVTSRKEELTADMSASRMSLWSGSGGFSPAAKLLRRSPAVGHSNQPSFNVGAFVGSPKTSQQPDRKVASPFYQGKTSFGGASSTRRMPVSVAPYQVDRPTRNQIKVRPKQSDDSLEGMSSAAKRILMTLEKMSSPVTDAKKIPNTNRSPVDLSLYLMPPRLRSNVVSTPTVTKGPPIANISTISKLTTLKSCMNRFQNTSMESFSSPKETRNPPVSETLQQDTLPKTLSPNKGPGKMRCKLTQKHQPSARNDIIEFEYTPLPSIPLPISTLPTFKQSNSLPTFDPKPSKPTNETTKSGIEFEFSPPIEVQPTLPPIVLQSNFPTSKSDKHGSIEKLPFTFSNPTELETPVPVPGLFTTDLTSKAWACSCCWVQNSLKAVKCVACETPRNKSNSVPTVNITSSSQITSKFNSITKPASTWQCSECWIQNPTADSKCRSCETPKIGVKSRSEFSNVAKPSSTWSCHECWIRNPATKSKCEACETPKKATPTGLSNSTQPIAKSSSTWSCHECWTQNPAHETKCMACETIKKGESVSAAPKLAASSGFGGSLSTKQSMWNCTICWVQNPIEQAKCLACEAPNPSQEKSAGSFHLSPPMESSQAGFNYPSETVCSAGMTDTSTFIKPPVASNETRNTVDPPRTTPNGALTVLAELSSAFPVSDWECDTCLVKNASDKLKCSACETLRPSKRSHSGFKGPESLMFNSPLQNSPITFKFGSFSIPVQTTTTTSTCTFGDSINTGASSFFATASNLTTTEKSSEGPKPTFSTETSNPKPVPAFKFGTSNLPTIEVTKPDIPVVDLVDNEDTDVQPSTIFGSARNKTSENSTSSTSKAFKTTLIGNPSDSGVNPFFKPPSSTDKSLEEPKSTLTDLSVSKSTLASFKFGAVSKPATEASASNIPVVDLVGNDNNSKPANIFAAAVSKASSEISASSNVFNITPSIGNSNFSMPVLTENKLSPFALAKEDNSTVTPQPTMNSIPISSQAGQSKENPTGGFNFKAPTALGSSGFGGFSMPTSNSDSSKTLPSATIEEKPLSKVLETSSDNRSDSPFFLGVSSSSNASPFTLTTANAPVFKMTDKIDAAKATESSWGKSDLTASTNSAVAPLFSFGVAATTASQQFSTIISKSLDVKPAVSVAPFSATAPTTSTFSFGSVAATTTQSSAPSGGFSFFAGTTAAAPAATSSLFTFGASSNAAQPAKTGGFPAATTTTAVFGASIPSSTSTFVFGAVKAEPVNSTTNFAFGSGTAPSATPSTFSGFPTSQPTPASNVFQFGSQPTNTTPVAPAFGAASGGFTFGAKSETPNQLAPATSQPNPGFGVPTMQQPMFGGVVAPTFGKTDKPTGFNFGAAAPSAPFMFGNVEKKQAPNQFSFGTPDSQNAGQFQIQPQFNISTPANFNFGATSQQTGPFQFAAASTPEQSTGPRKIRKAVRRVRNN